ERTLHTHPQATATPLLRGLKEQLHRSTKLALYLHEQPCGPEEHRRMAVVTAGVHATRDAAPEGYIHFLLDGQCVHVRAEGDAGAIPIPDRRDHSSLGDGVTVGNAQLIERPAHQFARSNLLVHQLGMLMERPTELDHPVGIRPGPVQDAGEIQPVLPWVTLASREIS